LEHLIKISGEGPGVEEYDPAKDMILVAKLKFWQPKIQGKRVKTNILSMI
jgi:hypothetical protein